MVITCPGEHVVLEIAAGQHLGEGVTHELGDALLTLRGAGGGIETLGHE